MEDFALAKDRAIPLSQLIPGTDDYYFYHCLHYQNQGRHDQVAELLAQWIRQHNLTPRARIIQNRHKLLTYQTTSAETLAYLTNELGLQFNHQRDTVDRAVNLPTRLDPQTIARERLRDAAFARHPDNLNGFEDSAFDWLAFADLDENRRRDLLGRMSRPDVKGLPRLVVDDLNTRGSGGFGSLGIHRQLLQSQLDECLRLKPDLRNEQQFVNTYLAKLAPNPDVDWQDDLDEREKYLNHIWQFVSTLSPSHNSLKANVLFHRLTLGIRRGKYDKPLFMSYLQLPRPAIYANPKFLERPDSQRYAANLAEDFGGVTQLPPVGMDEPLVRAYLSEFFLTETDTKPYEAYLNDQYLKEVLAETKIVNGLGDPQQWYPLLPPEKYQQLKERVDLDFAPTNVRQFAADQSVSLELFVKNVPTLIVKVYRVHAQNFYRDQGSEISTDLNLDGLVANEELTFQYSEPELRRIRRQFDFPNLTEPGTYIVDFLGNGRNSRALIQKGKLQYVHRTSVAGHLFTIIDEHNRPLTDAHLWMGGKIYKPEPDGGILVPFSTQPGRQPIVLVHGQRVSLDYFQHTDEQYKLQAGFFIDRESLISSQLADVIVRTALSINGTPGSIEILDEPRLEITSQDTDGVATSETITDLELKDDAEFVHTLRVPPRLASIAFTLRGRIRSLTRNEWVDVAASRSFDLNQMNRTLAIEALYFGRDGDEYYIDVRGKTGEPKANRPVQLVLKHKDFRDAVNATLRSDDAGHVSLGRLDDIAWLQATGPDGVSRRWDLPYDRQSIDGTIQASVGQTIEIPIDGQAAGLSLDDFSLLEVRNGVFVADLRNSATLDQGVLLLRNLPAGDYNLLMKRVGRAVQIRIADGDQLVGHIVGNHRILEGHGGKPLSIESVTSNDETITLKLHNANEFSRVHVFATVFEPSFDAFTELDQGSGSSPAWRFRSHAQALYVAGRRIGDEFRYILERKYAQKFPGNMTQRPELLLNPWAVRDTATEIEVLATDEAMPAMAPEAAAAGADRMGVARQMELSGDYPTLDFMPEPTKILLNQKPDEDGTITIERKQLGDKSIVRFVAVDPLTTVQRTVYLPAKELRTLDLRLSKNLDPARSFSQQKQITFVDQGEVFSVDDLQMGRFQVYDSLTRVFQLFETLNPSTDLAQFRFLLRWPELPIAEKRKLYSEHACHELNLYLQAKDPEFFAEVIQPYLRNKLHQTFVDHYLLDRDLSPYLDPWQFAQLNVVEKILLSRKVAGEGAIIARQLADQFQLIPPDIDRFNRLFDTALLGQAMDANAIIPASGMLRDNARAYFGMQAGEEAAKTESLERRSLGRAMRGGGRAGAMADDAAPPPGAAPQRPEMRADKLSLADAAEDAPMEAMDFGARRMKESLEEVRLRERGLSSEQLFRAADTTKEWAENNYRHLPILDQNADLVKLNAFWLDYANHDGSKPFRSTHLAEATSNFTEMMLALAALDLPVKSSEHKSNVEDGALRLTMESPAIIFHEQVRATTEKEDAATVLLSQNVFRQDDRYKLVDNQQVDKFVTDEFLVQTVYGCQVVVTNPTSSIAKLDLLLQIPAGAIPVNNSRYTRNLPLQLQPYHTESFEYFFYFPAEGNFEQFPVHATRGKTLVATAPADTFKAVAELSTIDRESWQYVSQQASDQEVVQYLDSKNLDAVDLTRIAFRMGDPEFFRQAIATLNKRHVFDPVLWSYGVKHNDPAAIRQFLDQSPGFVELCGVVLESPLLTINPVERKRYEHLEYHPLINARAHQIGKRRQILNDRFHGQYERWMEVLSYLDPITDQDRLATVYYLLLQDRLAEANGEFEQIDSRNLHTRMQYDYCAAYLALSAGDVGQARNVVDRYKDHPVDRWRNVFALVRNHLDEIEGRPTELVDQDSREQIQDELAASQPSFDFAVESKKIRIDYRNLTQVRVSYYLMDIELLFSRNPFVQNYAGQFAYIEPNAVQEITLPANGTSHEIELPEPLHNQNVLVEIEGAGSRQSRPYFSNSLALQLVGNYGQLKATDQQTGAPIAAAYVKVYARMNDGSVQFYRDGYTDLRGRFDYASLSTNMLDNVQRFSILVLSDQHGAVVREADPPKR